MAKPHVLIGMCIEMKSACSTNLFSHHCIPYTVYKVLKYVNFEDVTNSKVCNFMFNDHQAFDYVHEHPLPSMLHM